MNNSIVHITKLHELLKVALDDLALVELDSSYEVDMSEWHLPRQSTGKCQVCLAGAVMAKSLSFSKTRHALPANFDPNVRKKLEALDYLRKGFVEMACGVISAPKPPQTLRYIPITQYRRNKKQWWKEIRNLLNTLQEADI